MEGEYNQVCAPFANLTLTQNHPWHEYTEEATI